MNFKHLTIPAALSLAAFIGLVGCNENGSTTASAPTGNVVFSASLPSSELSKALIDDNTTTINIKLYSGSYYQTGGTYVEPTLIADVNVTRANPTITISKVPVGSFFAYVQSYDSNNNSLDRLNLGGEIVEGTNTLTATMIRGRWTLDTPITLNKTLSTDTARIDSFSIIPNAYLYQTTSKASFDFNSTLGYTDLPMTFNGANLPKLVYSYNQNTNSSEYNVTSTSETRSANYLMYLNQFKGPSTNTNALESSSDGPNLKPVSGTVVSDDLNNTRQFFIMGVDPAANMYEYYDVNSSTTFSDTTVKNYATSKVTAYNKMSGNIIETRTKSESYSETCSNSSSGATITCPWNQVNTASLRQKTVARALNAKATSVSKQAIGSDNCYRDLTVTDKYQYSYTYYDYSSGSTVQIPLTVKYENVWKGDACVHPFTATGTQLPSTDLNISVQRKR